MDDEFARKHRLFRCLDRQNSWVVGWLVLFLGLLLKKDNFSRTKHISTNGKLR